MSAGYDKQGRPVGGGAAPQMEFMSFGQGGSAYPNYSAYGGGASGGGGGASSSGWGGSNAASGGGTGWGGSGGGGGGGGGAYGGGDDDETPLLEELGIDPGQIVRRTFAMLNPLSTRAEDAGDDDLAGPLLFAFALGSLHLMRGRVHFGYILGWSALATFAMQWLLNQLAAGGDGTRIELYRCGSIIGYCMLPMCLLAAAALVLPTGSATTAIIAAVLVSWCTSKATAQFLRSLPNAQGKRLIVAYPTFTLYTFYALLSTY